MGKEVLNLFPLRIRHRRVIAIADEDKHSYNPAKGEAHIPLGEGAYSRTVRLHEALHALYSTIETPPKGDLLGQAVEDLRLHFRCAQLKGQPRRDELYSALRDLRLVANIDPVWGGSPKSVHQALVIFLRSLAIVQDTKGKYNRQVARAYKAVADLGVPVDDLMGALNQVFNHFRKSNDSGPAKELLRRFFEEPPSEEGEGEQPQQGVPPKPKPPQEDLPEFLNHPILKAEVTRAQESQTKQSKTLEQAVKDIKYAPKALAALQEHDYQGRILELFEGAPNELRKLISAGGYAAPPHMTIYNLSLTHPRESKDAPGKVGFFSGSRIRSKRLALAMASPVPVRCFERRKPDVEIGGTVLIDASSSMGLTDKALKEIIELMPVGTVAYYSGFNVCNGKGDLVVVAAKGKQYAFPEGEKLPHRHGENEIDYPALVWLLNQSAPRYFVTDGGFLGGWHQAAERLFKQAKNLKRVAQFSSLQECKEALEEGKLKRRKGINLEELLAKYPASQL